MANKKITRPHYVTADTFDPKHQTCFEECVGDTQTVAGEAYTIKELFQRHLNMNFPDSIAKEGFYADLEDFNMPDLSKLNSMDLVDRQATYEEIEDRARIARKKIEDHEKSQLQLEQEKAEAIANAEAAQKTDAPEDVVKGDKPIAE